MAAAQALTEVRVAKKKGEPKVPLYVKIRASLKERFERIAEANGRKLNAEMERALEAYCQQQEAQAEADKPQEGE